MKEFIPQSLEKVSEKKKQLLFRSYGFAFISVIYFYDALINMPYHI